ncbi:chromate efflux transporter [Geomesophilobacter sediminis]|uniref:Chromate efflux transporter n=1 Tax=Geomesophilobacter sediminis TaxID=2798584 RepID=A0A8J7S747_9BACT|nr:chromate efflux transporter [Geomesophilobacter sediminis]MBJ6726821.1 chromate efflux transporter [Geomesophilobacter sediminis]
MVPVGLWELVVYFLRLGASGFGGPIALAGYMQRDLIPRRWITEEEYREGLAFSQMMPGPLAAQLAMWIGFIRHGVVGASLVGLVFVLPALLIVVVIAWLYVAYHGLSVVQALFYGMGPTIIAIVARSAYRLALTTVGSDRRLWAIFGVVALVTVVARTEVALLFVAAGLIGVLLYSPPGSWRKATVPLVGLVAAPGTAGLLAIPLLLELGAFFVKAGAFTFGSGLAIVPFLHEGVVMKHHWLTEREFLDAVAVGIITPGPVVITAAFVGFLVAGLSGAVIAAAGVFLPVYLFVLFVGRYIVRYRDKPALKGFVKGATAAASGAIAGAAVILGEGSIFDTWTAVIGVASILILWRFKPPEPLLLAVAGVIGIVLYGR